MLFGHQDDTTNQVQPTDDHVAAYDSSIGATTSPPLDSSTSPHTQTDPSADAGVFDNPLADETNPPLAQGAQPVGSPRDEPTASSKQPDAHHADQYTEQPSATQPQLDGDLLELKQQALSQLTPLVDHLEQTPEEKFRTTMMMIQSTDNHELIKDAYAAAQAIPDDKARAQALLDVVNEINYFTQQKNHAA